MIAPNDDIDVCFAIQACRLADPEALRKSLGPASPSPVFEQPNSEALLSLAIRANSAECVQILLEAGAPTDPANSDRPLVMAAHGGSEAICSLLLHAGADPEAGGAMPSPLMIATMGRSASLCELLLRFGAHVASRSSESKGNSQGYRPGRQAIHYAVHFTNAEALRALLNAGADPLAEDATGQSARSMALATIKGPGAPACRGLISSFLERKELGDSVPESAPKRPGAL